MTRKPKSTVRVAIFHNILWSKYKGGVFSEIHRIAPQHGVEATFFQIAETEGERIALGGVDLTYHQYPFELLFKGSYHSVSLPKRILALMKQAWKTRADIVVLPGYERLEYWAMLGVLMLRRKPRAVFCDSTAYDRPRSLVKGLAKTMFFKCCDGFFGYGVRSKEYLMQYGAPEERIFFRCQAAALPKNYSESRAVHLREQHAPKDVTAPKFLYVGRLSPEKGLDTLLCAMQIVIGKLPNARLVIVGAGPTREDLERLSRSLDLTASVSFPGSMDVESLAIQYAESTAMVLPSTSEPWGLVVNEALSMGCPVIVSNRCGCLPELVISGKTGFEFQSGDAMDLARKMTAINLDMKDVDNVSIACIEHMRKFSPNNAAVQIIQGCRSILTMTHAK